MIDHDADLVARMRAGDESAFAELVRRYQPRLLRLARTMVPSTAIAEEVVQETWLGVVRGVDKFEGRSSFKTWLYRILANRARSAGGREQRAGLPAGDVVERFDRSGAWAEPPEPWADRVDDRLLADKVAARLVDLMGELPAAQREVVMLRDVEGLPAADVAAVVGVSDVHQRVLLHRGRARLRQLLTAEMA